MPLSLAARCEADPITGGPVIEGSTSFTSAFSTSYVPGAARTQLEVPGKGKTTLKYYMNVNLLDEEKWDQLPDSMSKYSGPDPEYLSYKNATRSCGVQDQEADKNLNTTYTKKIRLRTHEVAPPAPTLKFSTKPKGKADEAATAEYILQVTERSRPCDFDASFQFRFHHPKWLDAPFSTPKEQELTTEGRGKSCISAFYVREGPAQLRDKRNLGVVLTTVLQQDTEKYPILALLFVHYCMGASYDLEEINVAINVLGVIFRAFFNGSALEDERVDFKTYRTWAGMTVGGALCRGRASAAKEMGIEVDIKKYPTRRVIHEYLRNGRAIFKRKITSEEEEED
ncbi:hypothetical protein IFR05_007715 [Cadophora sp. M221]|nr:hypothetical protein IFR05_007715 [Cadophora sp. M221]